MKELLPTIAMKRINILIPECFYLRLEDFAHAHNISIKEAAELEILAAMFFRHAINLEVSQNTESDENFFTESLKLIHHRMDSISPRIAKSVVELAKLAGGRLQGKIVRRPIDDKTNQ